MKPRYIYKKYDWLDRTKSSGMYSSRRIGEYHLYSVEGQNYYKVCAADPMSQFIYLNKQEVLDLFESENGEPLNSNGF